MVRRTPRADNAHDPAECQAHYRATGTPPTRADRDRHREATRYENVLPGVLYEQLHHTADDQLPAVVRTLPDGLLSDVRACAQMAEDDSVYHAASAEELRREQESPPPWE